MPEALHRAVAKEFLRCVRPAEITSIRQSVYRSTFALLKQTLKARTMAVRGEEGGVRVYTPQRVLLIWVRQRAQRTPQRHYLPLRFRLRHFSPFQRFR